MKYYVKHVCIVSTFSLSFLYHIFATIYLASNMPNDALKLLKINFILVNKVIERNRIMYTW